jgi:ABC-type nickel/cobalt efflux system permease component RcnA
LSEKPGVRKWELIALGVSGGIVPCWDAILLLGVAVSAQRLWLALPLLLAFSAGLASVLIAIGISVVYARRWAGARLGPSLGAAGTRVLPILSAIIITILGFWLCYDSVQQGRAASTPGANSETLSREQ